MDRIYLLRLSNYEYFISSYTNTGSYYKSPHEILSELEKQVCFSNKIQDNLLIPYKEYGDLIFTFDRQMRDGNDVYLVYEYDCSIS